VELRRRRSGNLIGENQLADTATVEESVLFTDNLTKKDVEVDIVIRQTVNGIPICIGIECTSGGRRATVEWVRGMVGKHQTIPVDKTILVSRSGFTRQAIERAEAENILPLTLEQATNRGNNAVCTRRGDSRKPEADPQCPC
jgi:hypothetical protein